MKTYDQATYRAARRAWAEGDFRDPRWRDVYRLAADRGYIYPPTGTVHDDRDAEQPSQRAIVYAALCDTPDALRRIMARSSSWSQVVAQLIAHVDGLREDADLAEADAGWEREHRPTKRQATETVGAILGRLLAREEAA